MPLAQVQEVLEKNDVKRFITNVYLDTGYRNRNKLADALDKMIAKKIDETDYGSEKDLLDLLKFAHQMRIDEEKSANNTPTTQTNVQINEFGGGNYGELMKRLLQ
jgi:ATP-dependent exoDNAse (exonuclease V) beta subunit